MPDPTEPGPTGDYPDGVLNDEDEGGLMVAMSIVRGRVKIDFTKPIAWFALDPDRALAFAAAIAGIAHRAKGDAS